MTGITAYEPITKGWSDDKKYCVTTGGGTRYLLRVTPIEKRANRKDMFLLQQKAASLGVPMCEPVAFGECAEGVYTVHTWIDGRDAEEVIPPLPEEEQYAYGLEAGRILKRIHSIPAPPGRPEWEPRFLRKMEGKIKKYHECPVKFEGAEYLIAYMQANRRLLSGRPQCFQHGDYHIGNMMIENGKLMIIDFDRYDFGDPWEEFNRIVWCAQCSPRFACGIVDGYFAGGAPPAFWKLLALYIASNTLGSVSWAVPFGRSQINIMEKQAQDVLTWYDNMKNSVPAWYTSGT